MNARRGWRKLSCLQSISLSSLPLREISLEDRKSPHIHNDIQHVPSTWSQQHLPLSHLCPRNSYPCGNSGLNIHSKHGEGGRGLWLPTSSLPVNRRSCPLNDLLQKQGKQPKSYFLCFDWGLKHHVLAFNKPSELVKIGPWAYVIVDLTVVFHGNQRVRD